LTSAVFGDFLGAGRRLLEAAVAAGECEVAALPAVVPSVYRLVTVMCVYLEDLAPCDEIEAAGRTDLQAWERAVVDTGAALRIAADCLRHSILDLGPAGPPDGPAPSPARHLDAAATELAAGRDLLHTHITRTPDGLAQERSDWAPVVMSLPVTRALAAEIAAWSVRLALFTTWLAGLATGDASSRLTGQPVVVSARGELASASQWLLAASAALRPAHHADPVRAADADLLEAIPAAVPPPRQPLSAGPESIAELCDGITVSASRLRTAVHRGQDRARWSPDVTSGAWQWMAQAAAITSHLSELALSSLAERAGQHPALPVTPARLHAAADAMTGMRTAWQHVDLMWNGIITERRLLSTPAMSEASDLLLRMGRLVWDNPQWTPARAGRGPRRDPAALAPGPDAFTAVLAAAHHAADALACVAVTDIDTVQAAAQAGRLFVPTRSLPTGFDVPRAYAPALTDTVLELRDAYQDAAEASTRAAQHLDELAIEVAAPSRALGLARSAALAPARRRGSHGTRPERPGRPGHPLAGVSFTDSRASTGLPGPVERAIRQRRVRDPVVLLRAAAIDNAARSLIGLADTASPPPKPRAAQTAGHGRDAVLLAAEGFPHDPDLSRPASPSPPGRPSAAPPSDRAHLRKT
jgi:hypothetical protein